MSHNGEVLYKGPFPAKSFIIFFFVWAITFFLFATQINIKEYYGNPSRAVITGETVEYNFEYKRGFPTPWYSAYYNIPEAKSDLYENSHQGTCRLFDSNCAKTSTPTASSRVAVDRSYDILAVQAVLALIPVGTLGIIYYMARKYAHHRH
ncbi:MAG: hypothetical protein JWL89_493 [Candidatus Saccharibacteria bacterium]|nr:hypothetical protein [Candidatus Saccharibacteria bacterium]